MDKDKPRIFRAGADATEIDAFPERELSDAIGRWDASPHGAPSAVINAACQALVAELDSPALRILAGMAADSRRDDIDAVIADALDELGIPRAADLRQGLEIAPRGGVRPRAATDRIRFAIVAAPESVGGFEIQVFVNDVEMTSAGAGMGMDPFDILVPDNQLIATGASRRILIARCHCGVYGCGGTDVSILRDGDVVHWDWHEEVPMRRGVTIRATDYDIEVARLAADLSWETPERTAGRIVLTHADREALAKKGLKIGWVANDYRDHSRFCVCLTYANSYQVFLYTPWNGRTPHELASAIVRKLSARPKAWDAEWHSMKSGGAKPSIAGRHWRRHPMP